MPQTLKLGGTRQFNLAFVHGTSAEKRKEREGDEVPGAPREWKRPIHCFVHLWKSASVRSAASTATRATIAAMAEGGVSGQIALAAVNSRGKALRWAEPRVGTDFRGREHPLPAPVPIGVRVLPRQRVRQLHAAESRLEVALVLRRTRSKCVRRVSQTAAGSIVTLSLFPLPSRTRISFLVKSMSLTRSRKHSISRSPDP